MIRHPRDVFTAPSGKLSAFIAYVFEILRIICFVSLYRCEFVAAFIARYCE